MANKKVNKTQQKKSNDKVKKNVNDVTNKTNTNATSKQKDNAKVVKDQKQMVKENKTSSVNDKKNTKKESKKSPVKTEEKVVKKENNKPSEKTIEKVVKTEKTEKKLNTNKEKITTSFDKNNELVKLIKIVLIVTGVMLVFYLITLVATHKADEVNNSNKNDSKTETSIQYEYLMIGTMLNKSGTYYVLVEESEDNRLSEYNSIIQSIKVKDDAEKIYRANLTDAFNKGYLSKEANHRPEDIKDFRVTGTTLVKVEENKIAEVWDSYDSIKDKLTELSK